MKLYSLVFLLIKNFPIVLCTLTYVLRLPYTALDASLQISVSTYSPGPYGPEPLILHGPGP